jgi:hypothetical protein
LLTVNESQCLCTCIVIVFVRDPVIGDYLCGQSLPVLYVNYVILCNGLVVFNMFVCGKSCKINIITRKNVITIIQVNC